MSRKVNTSFIVAGLLVILSAGISPSVTEGGGRGGLAGGRIFPLSGASEGLCAKIGELPEGAAPVMKEFPHLSGLAMGYVDYKGRWVIPPRFRRAEAFSRGIARVQDADDQPYYYIDHSGKRVSDELLQRTQAGLVRVENNNKRGFADPQTGEIVVETKYDGVRDFSEGLAVVLNDSTVQTPNGTIYRWTWIDYTGREVVALDAPYGRGNSWPGVGPFREGLAAVMGEVGGSGVDAGVYKFGFIDHNGTFAIEPRFDCVGDFHNGRAEVCIDGKWGFIDHTGTIVIPLEYAMSRPFSEGLAAVKLTPERATALGLPPAPGVHETGNPPPGWWGYVDLYGKLVIPAQYQEAEAFADGVAYVKNSDFQGYIDNTGNVAFDLTVDWDNPPPPK
jgi:hypothetical protein